MMELQNLPLPPGWDCRLDHLTGKTYFINHITKVTTWDDPRMKNAPLNKQVLQHPLQQTGEVVTQHGSPDLRRNYVYPSQSSPKPAFQIPGHNSPKYIPLQDLKSNSKMSPLLLRTSQTQDSSLNIPDTEESVAKISGMFQTVSDTHIRLLLKKYHGREAVVISALQVQKHPITTPGPFATPPPSRNIYPGLHSSLQMTPPLGFRSYSRGGSPVTRFGSIPINTNTDSPRIGDGFRNSRPHSSPKLKLRYMKCIFPKAEETVILDVLTNSDNNIQKASDWLKRMGYERKDPVKLQQQAEEARLEEERQKNKEMSEAELPHIPKIKTTEEKVATKERLQEQYKDLVEQVITIALDSVQYDEDRAKQILQIMMEEDNKTQSSSSCKSEEPEASTDATEVDGLAPGTLSTSQSRQSFKSLLNNDKNDGKNRNINDSSYKSTYLSNFYGANPENVRGANDKLLLTDYIPVRGWNLSLRTGPQTGLAKGPNKNNLINKNYIACGPNSQLCKGPKPGLAKGSIFQHLRNIVNSESRGK